MSECAVWYWRYHSVYVELFASEASAISFAIGMADIGEGSVSGVQYSDGRFVERDDWSALKAEQDRQYEQWRREFEEERRNPKPAPPMRTVVPPFDARGQTAQVDPDAPAWLGAQTAERAKP